MAVGVRGCGCGEVFTGASIASSAVSVHTDARQSRAAHAIPPPSAPGSRHGFASGPRRRPACPCPRLPPQVVRESLYDAFYKLTDSRSQITSYVFDEVRRRGLVAAAAALLLPLLLLLAVVGARHQVLGVHTSLAARPLPPGSLLPGPRHRAAHGAG